MRLEDCTALLLNADYRPMTAAPLSVLGWKESLQAALRYLEPGDSAIDGGVDVLDTWPMTVRSAGGLIVNLPRVVAARRYVDQSGPAPFTRAGVMLRDGHRCCYCLTRLTPSILTFDHVVPRSTGGKTGWSNIVSACEPCNARKANHTAAQRGMRLQIDPFTPSRAQMIDLGLARLKLSDTVPDAWRTYLNLGEAPVRAAVPDGRVFPAGMAEADYWNVELESDDRSRRGRRKAR